MRYRAYIPLRRYAAMALVVSGLFAQPVLAEVVVVAGPQSQVSQLSREQVVNIFMGGYRKLPDGTFARPIDLDAEAATRRSFYRHLLDKSLEEINAYWARLVFSGRTTPPEVAKDIGELLDRLSRDPRAIGYVDRQQLARAEFAKSGRDIKVLFALQE